MFIKIKSRSDLIRNIRIDEIKKTIKDLPEVVVGLNLALKKSNHAHNIKYIVIF